MARRITVELDIPDDLPDEDEIVAVGLTSGLAELEDTFTVADVRVDGQRWAGLDAWARSRML